MSQSSQRSYFITLEGGEGVGKTTAAKFINHYLASRNIDVCMTREPGGTPIAEKIRQIVLQKNEEDLTIDTELLLLFAARAQHIQHVIKPALAKGQWVICDRFTDASYAYQGAGRGVNFERIATLEEWVQGDFRPDMTILFDAPIEVCLERISQRGALDRIESQDKVFFEKVRDGYLQRAKQNLARFRIVNTDDDLAKIQHKVITILDEVRAR